MRYYRNLYQEIISDNNIRLAIKESCKSKKKNKKKQKALEKLKENPNRVKIVRKWIEDYQPIKRKPHEIYDGICRKKRYIYVPSVRETVVQHAVVQILDKYLMNGIYEHTYAAIKGRGQHMAKNYIKKYISRNPKKVKYYLKMDIKQYFPSIPQKKIIQMLSRQVKDTKVINLVTMILNACDDGIPLGYYISQWLANFYLRDMDHHIKDEIGNNLYVRWMDDMVVFSSNKRQLHRYKIFIEKELESLGLTLKKNWRIVRFDHRKGGCFLDYMGFRFYRNKVTLRRSIYIKLCRKANRISKKEKPTIYDIKQFMSYLGWIKDSNVYNAYLQWVKPYINIQYCKRRISRYDRNNNKARTINIINGGTPT